jgi:hypothetical protein
MHLSLSSGIMAITAAAILIGSITVENQLFASVECKSCITQFQILTRTFGADAGKIILTDNSIPISKFIQLNLQFEKNIIKAVYAGHVNTPNDPVLRDLVSKYGDDLLRLGPPDQVKPLLEAYQAAVLRLFTPLLCKC